MEGKKSISRAILVFGAPCSGKSTFCKKFSNQFKAPYYDLSQLKVEYNLSRKQILMLVEQIAKTGITIVIEGGIDTEQDRQEIRNILRKAGYEPSLIWIQTDVSTIKSRLKTRLKSVSKAKAEYENKVKRLEAPSEAEPTIILSGKHTYPTQAKHVLTQLAE